MIRGRTLLLEDLMNRGEIIAAAGLNVSEITSPNESLTPYIAQEISMMSG